MTILHSFGDGTVANDTVFPDSLMQGSDGNLYGSAGGAWPDTDFGALFKSSTSGVESPLHSFWDGTVPNDGFGPGEPINGPDGDLYGITDSGGSGGISGSGVNFYGGPAGTAYKITPDGTETILHSFDDGSVPYDGIEPVSLVLGSDGNFYGTTAHGGVTYGMSDGPGYGTVFKMTPGGDVTILHSFNDGTVANDGEYGGKLIQGSDGALYGITQFGGSSGQGAFYKITTSGTVTILHSFKDGIDPEEGCQPADLIQGSDGTFYGTTPYGGAAVPAAGTIFRITPSGVASVLHSWQDGTVINDGSGTANIGEGPDGVFYGVTASGGSKNRGTAYEMSSTGRVVIVHSFADGSVANDGTGPMSLIRAGDGTYYGVTGGGSAGRGTLFKMVIQPSAVTFFNADTTTQGNWKGVYGGDGWNIAGDPSANNPTIPSYATVSITGSSLSVPALSTTDPRALLKSDPAATDRVAGMWNAATSETFDINLADANVHRIALYFLDWENDARVQSITITDPTTNAVLDTRSVSNFQNGIYDVWDIRGHVLLTVTYTGSTGSNAAVSGIFFGAANVNAPGAPSGLVATGSTGLTM